MKVHKSYYYFIVVVIAITYFADGSCMIGNVGLFCGIFSGILNFPALIVTLPLVILFEIITDSIGSGLLKFILYIIDIIIGWYIIWWLVAKYRSRKVKK